MTEFLQTVGREVVVGLIVTTIVGIFTWIVVRFRRSVSGQPSAHPATTYGSMPTAQQSSVLPPAENSWRATWALGLGVGSYVLWLIAAPLVFPAIALSLWFGIHGRRAKNGFLATTGIFASLIHAVLIVVVVVLLIFSYQNQPDFTDFSTTTDYGFCVTDFFGSCPMQVSLPSGSSCICYAADGGQYAGIVVR